MEDNKMNDSAYCNSCHAALEVNEKEHVIKYVCPVCRKRWDLMLNAENVLIKLFVTPAENHNN